MRGWLSYLFGPDRPILVRRLIRLFLWRWLVILGVIVGVLQVLDLLNTTEELLAPEGATEAAVWAYFKLRWPQLVSQFSPFAALLAALVVLSGMSNSNEITAMRAGGLSAMRVIAPFLAACGVLSLAHFSFHELVAAPAAARLEVWEDTRYEPNFAITGEIADLASSAFVAESGVLLKADQAERLGERALLKGVTLYQRQDGVFSRVMHAASGVVENGVYEFKDARTLDLTTGRVEAREQMQMRLPISIDRLFVRARDPEQTSLPELLRLMSSMRAEGSPAAELETVFWTRFLRPMATLVMPFMAAVAGFGLTRHGGTVARLLAGGALGFSFFVVQSGMAAMGKLAAIDPLIAAASPLAIYAAIGVAFSLSID